MKPSAISSIFAAALLAAGCGTVRGVAGMDRGVRFRDAESAAAARVAAMPPASDRAFALASPFSDHMVLQRDCPIPVWGTGEPGAKVSVMLMDANREAAPTATAVVGGNGRFVAVLPPVPAGGPYRLLFAQTELESKVVAVLSDVLVGDVWLCGGQSNMEMNFGWGVKNGEKELADADLPQVRLLHVERALDVAPRDKVAGKWTPCNAETARPFSACGFFFGRKLQRETGVPVGLVEDCWSGTIAETWLSLDGAAAVPGLDGAVANRRRDIAEWADGGPEAFRKRHDAWAKAVDPFGGDPAAVSADGWTEAEGWADASMPFSFEKQIAGDYDGVVWLRRSFSLAPEQAAATNAALALGKIDDADDVWLNGVHVGRTAGWQTPRRYAIPDGLLRAESGGAEGGSGLNTLAIRVKDTGGGGGFHGEDSDVPRLEFGNSAPALSLAGEGWRGFAGPSFRSFPEPKNPVSSGPNVPAACYNGMIAPLFPMAVKGAIWYQGCSNVGRDAQYRTLLPAVIGEWRDGFVSAAPGGAFPFYIVQLAAYLGTHERPFDSQWAAMRWAQTQIGLSVPASGTVVALDVGDHGDIHPKDKRAVGERLAALALARTYGRADQALSPVPADGAALASVDSALLRVRFVDPASGKPAALKSGAVKGFQTSLDGKTFEWAEATAEGDVVTVGHPDADPAAQPVAVRYAWDDYPDCDLATEAGLPVGPFELPVGAAR